MRNIINTLKYTLYIQIGWIKWVLDPLRPIPVLFLWNLVPFLWNPVIPADSGPTPVDSCPTPVDSCPTPVDSTGVLWVLQEWGGHWKVLLMIYSQCKPKVSGSKDWSLRQYHPRRERQRQGARRLQFRSQWWYHQRPERQRQGTPWLQLWSRREVRRNWVWYIWRRDNRRQWIFRKSQWIFRKTYRFWRGEVIGMPSRYGTKTGWEMTSICWYC